MSGHIFFQRRSSGNIRQWVLLACAFAIGVFLVTSSHSGTPQKNSVSPPLANAAVVRIVFQNTQQPRAFSGPVVDGMTIADALSQAARAGNFSVSFDASGMPVTIDAVSSSWNVVRNGQSVGTPLTETPIVAGDEVVISSTGS